MTPLAFIDCETTGTNPAIHHMWEVALVLEDDRQITYEGSWFVRPPDMQFADPAALDVGGYWQRFPHVGNEAKVDSDADVATLIANFTAGAIIVGNNPSFDVSFLRPFLARNDFAPGWHYNPVDVKAIAAGVLGLEPPWSTDQLLEALEIDPDLLGIDRHTARGDVEISRAMYHMTMIDRDELILGQATMLAAQRQDKVLRKVPPPVEPMSEPDDTVA